MSIFQQPEYFIHDGLRLAYYQAGPKEGAPILLVHGWPEIAYSWKNQMPVLAAAGYRAIAVDLRGFGASDAPLEAVHYGVANLVSDLEALLDHLGISKIALLGHDWGGIIIWHAARMMQSRVSHVMSVSTPHVRLAPIDPIKIFRKRHGQDHYFVDFCDHIGRAEALFAQDPDAFFRLMFRTTPPGTVLESHHFHIPKNFKAYLEGGAPDMRGAIMADDDRAYYTKAYARSGFHGGHNLYRNTTANWELGQGLSLQITQPSLMISAREDLFLPPEFTDPMVDMVPDLERHIIERCGHWVMWEQPEALNALLLDWLSRRLPA
jgi:pimeloyl-ACP methyl ester carboxylesterase